MTPDEALYFDNFRLRAVHNLASRDSQFWHRTVLREGSHDECVRSALIALGALARAMDMQFSDRAASRLLLPLRHTQLGTFARQTPSGRHYYHALTYYTHALGVFRRRLARSRQDMPRAMLIATILLASFEYLQGNTKCADQLSACTLSMLRDTIMQGRIGTATRGHQKTSSSSSLIAAPIDDAGVREAEMMLVRNTIFNAAFSPLYPHARDAILGLPVPSFQGPRPPGLDVPCDVFISLGADYLTLVSVWHYRVLTTMPSNVPTCDDVNMVMDDDYQSQKSARIKTWWTKSLRQKADIIAVLAEWLVAFHQRLSLPDLTPLDRFICQSNYVAAKTCYQTVCTALDTSSRSADVYDAAVADILTETEAVFLASVAGPENNFDPNLVCSTPSSLSSSSQSSSSSSTILCSDSSPAATRMQDQAIAAGGAIIGVGTIAHSTRSAKLRRRAMDLYARMVTPSSHWDIQATYLGTKALFEAEEEAAAAAAAGDQITEEKSSPLPRGQWFWVGGRWNEEYTEFSVVLASKAVGMDGSPMTRLVAMPAVTD